MGGGGVDSRILQEKKIFHKKITAPQKYIIFFYTMPNICVVCGLVGKPIVGGVPGIQVSRVSRLGGVPMCVNDRTKIMRVLGHAKRRDGTFRVDSTEMCMLTLGPASAMPSVVEAVEAFRLSQLSAGVPNSETTPIGAVAPVVVDAAGASLDAIEKPVPPVVVDAAEAASVMFIDALENAVPPAVMDTIEKEAAGIVDALKMVASLVPADAVKLAEAPAVMDAFKRAQAALYDALVKVAPPVSIDAFDKVAAGVVDAFKMAASLVPADAAEAMLSAMDAPEQAPDTPVDVSISAETPIGGSMMDAARVKALECMESRKEQERIAEHAAASRKRAREAVEDVSASVDTHTAWVSELRGTLLIAERTLIDLEKIKVARIAEDDAADREEKAAIRLLDVATKAEQDAMAELGRQTLAA